MSFKIAASKDNIDVMGTTGTVPNNLTYSSDYNTLKYYAQGSLTVAGSAAVGQSALYRGTLTHNLNYYPYCECMIQEISSFGVNTRYYLNEYNAAPAGPYTFKAFFDIGTTNVVFYLLLTNFDIFGSIPIYGTVNFYYKLFRNNLGL